MWQTESYIYLPHGHFKSAYLFIIIPLQDALSLPGRRPPFHASSIIPLIVLLLYVLPKLTQTKYIVTPNIHWIFFVAWSSHHLRDGHRRGLWFPPLGSTPPVPRTLYLAATILLPLFVRAAFFLHTIHFAEKNLTVLESV